MDTPDPASVQEAVAQLDKVRRRWLQRPEVGAVDVGYRLREGQLTGELAIRVHLEHKLPRDVVPPHELFPEEVGGITVDVLEAMYEASTPSATAPPDGPAVSRRSRVAPLMGGISIGNPRVTAGTLGAVVWSTVDGAPHILSNWHVLAGSEPRTCCGGKRSVGQPHYQAVAGPEPHYQAVAGVEPHYQAVAGVEPHYQSASRGQPHYQSAAVGEPIYQPARFDGGTSADVVARLSDVRLDQHMDAALARIDGTRPYSCSVLGVGVVAGVHESPHLGMAVVKSGRSSEVTSGFVDGVSLSTKIDFDHGQQWFHDQLHIVPTPPWPLDGPHGEVSDGGDSGSVWVEEGTNLAVGLHFAGERDPAPFSEHALANPKWRVARELGFTFTPTLHESRRAPAAGRGAPSWAPGSGQDAVTAARAALAEALLLTDASLSASGASSGGRSESDLQRSRRILQLAWQALQ